MKDRLVPAAIIPILLDLSIRNRINVDSVFKLAGVDSGLVSREGTYISVDQLLRLFDAAYDIMQKPAFGILMGEASEYHSLDVVGPLVATSRNVQEALDELFQFKDLILPFIHFSLEEHNDDAILVYSIDHTIVVDRMSVHHDVVSTALYSISSALVPDGIRLKKVRYMHSKPEYAEEYDRVFGVPIEFDCLRNEIIFDRKQLQEPLLTSYPDYHEGVKAIAKEKLRSIESRESFSAKVSFYIRRQLGNTSTQLDDVAAHFNMTPRTMQRKLKVEGSSFVTLRDKCRHARAIRDLGDPNVDINDLAELLGFSDASNFYHAFKRWEGVSPGSFRKKSLEARGLKLKKP